MTASPGGPDHADVAPPAGEPWLDRILLDRPNLIPTVARLIPFPGSVRRPTFVVGTVRSGKTLLAGFLGGHSSVALYPGEANHLWHPQLYPWSDSRYRMEIPPIWRDPAVFAQGSLALRTSRDNVVLKRSFRAYQLLRRKPVLLNDSALICFHLPLILAEFPDAKIIHVVRDGRVVAATWARRQLKAIERAPETYREAGQAVTFRELLEYCAASWTRQVRAVDLEARALRLAERDRLLSVRYEDFCRDAGTVLARVCAFLSLDPQRLPRAGLDRVEDWNDRELAGLDPEDLDLIGRTTYDGLERFGYATEPSTRPTDN